MKGTRNITDFFYIWYFNHPIVIQKSRIIDTNFYHVEERNDRNEIFAKRVKAGKRTYFFDLKATRSEDFYLTITESKKKFAQDGTFIFEKHKIFLYKEDFEKFIEALHESYDKVKELMPDYDFSRPVSPYDDEEKEMNWE